MPWSRERAREYNARVRRENIERLQQYKATHPCVDCGESNPIVLQFDHVRGEKLFNLSNARSNRWGWQKIQEEIDKCEVRCANCHLIVTHSRRLEAATRPGVLVQLNMVGDPEASGAGL